MKRVLITGKDSYIGRSLISWLESKSPNIYCEELDVKEKSWKNFDFSTFDVVFHVAGIAHVKETKKNSKLFYKINRDLAIKVAEKAKKSGIKQLIFMSTMSVYGLDEGCINQQTPAKPKSAYGKSKLEAEESIMLLNNEQFKVSIIRPPMIYGPGSKGNYSRLSEFAKKTRIFPSIDNKRSMLFIGNLCILLKELIDDEADGYFYPQNDSYMSTKSIVSEVSRVNGNKVYFFCFLNPIIKYLNIKTFKKVFGSLTYDQSMSLYKKPYQKYKFIETIKLSEED